MRLLTMIAAIRVVRLVSAECYGCLEAPTKVLGDSASHSLTPSSPLSPPSHPRSLPNPGRTTNIATAMLLLGGGTEDV